MRVVPEPTSHIGWAFTGASEFESRASTFLAEGLARQERLIYVADDPNVEQWPEESVKRGDLLIRSTSEIYGPQRVVNASSQRATFEDALSDALHSGYTGLRVVADNTSLIDGPVRLAAWMRWESEAERFITENPVVGLCAFDRVRADAEDLQTAVSAHRAIAPQVP